MHADFIQDPRRTRLLLPQVVDHPQVLLQQQIGVPVEMANPFKRIEFSEKDFDLEYLRDIGPVMAVAVGLAARKEGDR